MYDQPIVVSAFMQLEILDRIHEAHQGIMKCRARARRSLWWLRMLAEIQEMVANCRICQQTSPTPTEPLLPSSLPDRPWERIGANLLEFKKTQYLLLVNRYSRWIKVTRLTSTSSQSTIEKCKAIFASHGIPEMLLSDSGSQFASAEFSKFTNLPPPLVATLAQRCTARLQRTLPASQFYPQYDPSETGNHHSTSLIISDNHDNRHTQEC